MEIKVKLSWNELLIINKALNQYENHLEQSIRSYKVGLLEDESFESGLEQLELDWFEEELQKCNELRIYIENLMEEK